MIIFFSHRTHGIHRFSFSEDISMVWGDCILNPQNCRSGLKHTPLRFARPPNLEGQLAARCCFLFSFSFPPRQPSWRSLRQILWIPFAPILGLLILLCRKFLWILWILWISVWNIFSSHDDYFSHAKSAEGAKILSPFLFTLALEWSQTSLQQECAESFIHPLPHSLL